MPPSAYIDALELLRRFRGHAGQMATAAEEYIDAMTSADRAAAEIGHAYMTFDGSIVYVARRVTKCKCPMCTGRAGLIFFGMSMAVPEPDEFQGDHEEAEPPQFIAIVLRGGHGIEGLAGCRPGDAVAIDAAGMVLMEPLNERLVSVSRQHLALAGLSLREKLRLEVRRDKAALE